MQQRGARRLELAFYCNKKLDAQAAEADALADPNDAQKRLAAWQIIYRSVMADAPWVLLYNEKLYALKLQRIGNKNLFTDPILHPHQLCLCVRHRWQINIPFTRTTTI